MCSKHLRSLTLFITFAALAAQAGNNQSSAPTKTPVVINLPDDAMAHLTAHDRQVIQNLKTTLESNLWNWGQFNIELPETAFNGDTTIVRLKDLFLAPDNAELFDLAKGSDGKFKKLDPAQIESIRDTALLIVPSKKYPGQNHVWKVSLWLQKGRKNIEISLQKSKSQALDQIIVQIPNRWGSDNGISIRHGLVNIYKGLRQTFSSLVGTVEDHPKYDDSEIGRIVARQAENFAQGSLALSKTEKYDLRLYDDKLWQKASGRVEKVALALEQSWPDIQQSLLPDMIAELPKDLDRAAAMNLLTARMEQARINVFYKMLHEDSELEALSPGLAKLIIDRDMATRTALELERIAQITLNNEAKKIEAEITAENPIRARISSWLRTRVEEKLAPVRDDLEAKNRKILVGLLREQGLSQEAALLEKALAFYESDAVRLKENMGAEREADRVFEIQSSIFFAKNWIKEQSDRYDGKVYYAKKYTTDTVSTNMPGWRLELAALRTKMLIKCFNYAMIMQNLVNGPIGIKSLFLNSRFAPWMKMDEKTGEIVPNKEKTVDTLLQRHRDIWQMVAARKARFESQMSHGFISKDALRPLYYGVTNLQGAALTAGLWTIQPTLTAANVAVSGSLVVTSPLWATAANILWWGFDAAVLDTARPLRQDPKFLPVVQSLMLRGGGGLIEATGAFSAAVVVHPAAASVISALGETKAFARTMWDGLMSALFLHRADLPAQNSVAITRIQGPDLSREFYFQISPDLALVALRAALERYELKTFENRTRMLIAQPKSEADAKINQLLGATLNLAPAEQSDWQKELVARRDELTKSLEGLLKKRRESMPTIIEKGSQGRIRMSEDDLNQTMARAQALVEEFWQEKISPLLGENEVATWSQFGLSKNDFANLTVLIMQRIFGESIITSLQATDKSLVIKVDAPDLSNFVSSMTTGQPVPPGLLGEETNASAPLAIIPPDTKIELTRTSAALMQSINSTACQVLLRGY